MVDKKHRESTDLPSMLWLTPKRFYNTVTTFALCSKLPGFFC